MPYFIKIFLLILGFETVLFLSNSATAADSPLTGYAWSENAGWINFTNGSATINNDSVVTTGEIKGYAWGENIGWINFNCSNDSSCVSGTNFKVSADLSLLGLPCAISACPACGSCRICETPASADTTPPTISDILITDVSRNSAVVTWKTNETTDSIIEYGTDTTYKFLTGNPGDIITKVLVHSVNFKSLISDTTYHFKIISRDTAGNIFTSDDQTFKTLESNEPDEADNPDDLQLILPEEAIVKNLTNSSTSISWQTDLEANSLVRVKIADAPNSEWQEIGDTSNYVLDHTVTLTGLKANTAYEYQVKSSNSSGSTAISKTKTFKTNPAPVISDVVVSDITLDSAVVSWKSNISSTTEIDFGPSVNYGSNLSGGTRDLVTSHEMKLKNLESGVNYNFRVKGTDENNNLIVSDNYNFTTFAMPVILDYDVETVGDSFASLKWTSNSETDSIIVYTNTKTSESRTQGDTKLTKDHSLKLTDIEPGTEYILKMEGTDILGNKVSGSEIKIKTLEDNIPPEIMVVRTYTTIIQNRDKGQVVVAWKTDEPATSQVFLYSMSNRETPIYTSVYDANPTTNHTVVMSEMALGATFRFNIESKDKSGNSTLSGDFSVQTPSVRKSIIQMIVEAFEKIFGWTKNINA